MNSIVGNGVAKQEGNRLQSMETEATRARKEESLAPTRTLVVQKHDHAYCVHWLESQESSLRHVREVLARQPSLAILLVPVSELLMTENHLCRPMCTGRQILG